MIATSALVVGFLLGAVLHAVPRLRRIVDPLLATYYSVPIFVFYPVFIVAFGLNAIPKTIIGFLYALIAVVINTLNGLDRVPVVLWKTAKAHSSGRCRPRFISSSRCAAPYLFTGVKLAIAYAFYRSHRLRVHSLERRIGLPDLVRVQQFSTDVITASCCRPQRCHHRQHGAVCLGAEAHEAAGRAMSTAIAAFRPTLGRMADIVLLVGALLGLWQIVHHFAGAIAMTAPLDTFRYTLKLVASADFWPHVYSTGTAFALALLIAAAAGSLIGAILGFHRLSAKSPNRSWLRCIHS